VQPLPKSRSAEYCDYPLPRSNGSGRILLENPGGEAMASAPSTDLVWKEIQQQIFAVLGFVSATGEARTAGIVYVVRGRELFVGTDRKSWKARHIAKNPNVSLTVTIPKRIPLLPWIKIPPATVTFQGNAVVSSLDEVSAEVQRALFRGLELDAATREGICILRVVPRGEFVTYGVGVPLLTMRHPKEAQGRAPTGTDESRRSEMAR
jgi:hypothetical protein